MWHRGTKALCARLSHEEFIEHFKSLIEGGLSWAIEVNEELIGMVILDPSPLPGETIASDYAAHVALARKAWGKGVIQQAGEVIIPTFFRKVPDALRLTAWTSERNYPSRSVIEELGFTLEGKMQDAVRHDVGGHEALLIYGLLRKEV